MYTKDDMNKSELKGRATIKYCVNCGRALQEGEVCNCTEQNSINEQIDKKRNNSKDSPNLWVGAVLGIVLLIVCALIIYCNIRDHRIDNNSNEYSEDVVNDETKILYDKRTESALELVNDMKDLEERICKSIGGDANGVEWKPVMYTEVFPNPEENMTIAEGCSLTADELTARIYVIAYEDGRLRVRIRIKNTTNTDNYHVYQSEAQPMMIAVASPVLNAFCGIDMEEADDALDSIDGLCIDKATSIIVQDNTIFSLDLSDWYSCVIEAVDDEKNEMDDTKQTGKVFFADVSQFKEQYCRMSGQSSPDNFKRNWHPSDPAWNVIGEYEYFNEVLSDSNRKVNIYALNDEEQTNMTAVKIDVYDNEKAQVGGQSEGKRAINVNENQVLLQNIQAAYAALLGIQNNNIPEKLIDKEFIQENEKLLLPGGILLQYDGNSITLY